MTQATLINKFTASSTLYLLDASIVYFKYYFSMPDHWYSEDNYPTGAVYGYTHWLKRFLMDVKPTAMAACFDESLGTCFRNELDANYKCSRPPADDIIAYQLAMCKSITQLMGVPVYASPRFEADDLIATLAHKHQQKGDRVCILSRDKDLLQLLRPGDYLWDYGKAEPVSYDDCEQKMGVKPEQVADYLALVGDAIDDIPGVPGIGAKTAQRLLQHFSDIEQLYDRLELIHELKLRGAKNIVASLALNKNRVLLNKQLTQVSIRATLNKRRTTKKLRAQNAALQALTKSLGFEFKVTL